MGRGGRKAETNEMRRRRRCESSKRVKWMKRGDGEGEALDETMAIVKANVSRMRKSRNRWEAVEAMQWKLECLFMSRW